MTDPNLLEYYLYEESAYPEKAGEECIFKKCCKKYKKKGRFCKKCPKR